jgi:hypothetical protein
MQVVVIGDRFINELEYSIYREWRVAYTVNYKDRDGAQANIAECDWTPITKIT